jgi:hypothetical protein
MRPAAPSLNLRCRFVMRRTHDGTRGYQLPRILMIRKFCSRRKLAIGKTEIREFECCGWRPSGGRSVFAEDTGLKGALNRGKAIEEGPRGRPRKTGGL